MRPPALFFASSTRFQQLGFNVGKSHDVSLWDVCNSFVEVAEARMEILQLPPGGLMSS